MDKNDLFSYTIDNALPYMDVIRYTCTSNKIFGYSLNFWMAMKSFDKFWER